MYQPGKGTWFAAELTLTREGRFSVDFDYDLEPPWHGPAPSGREYADDLWKFRRDPEHIPGWLRAKLDEAGAP